jgi:hypothetical protein
MKRFRKLLGLGLAAALVWAGCAPTDPGADKADARNDTPAYPIPEPRLLATEPAAASGNQRLLKDRVEAVIEQVRQRDLLLTNGFWTVFHGILGLGPGIKLKQQGGIYRVNAVDYIFGGRELRGLRFIPTEYGLDVETGEQFVSQGHQDQFIAEMAQCGIPADREIIVGGKHYQFMDFVRHSQMRARITDKQELSWTIVVVGQYLGTDISWTNGAGEQLRFEDLVRYEADADVENAACGGTHRLFGLKWAYNLHLKNGGQTVGVWKDLLDEQIRYQRLAREYQNPDGSFSTEFFRGPGKAADMQARMYSTGHILEWLAYSLPKEELHQDWLERAVYGLAGMFLDIQDKPMESGALYHAVHGLRIYHDRVFGEGLGEQKPFLVLAPDTVGPKPEKK